MARRNITMQHIKQLLLLRSRGIGIKQCSRELNLARNTVKKYLARCDELDHSLDELLSLAEPELLGLLEQKVPLSSQAKQQFDSMAEELVRELDRPGVTRRLLWEEYVACGALTMEYSWFCELLKAHRRHKKTTMIMKHEPGNRAYLDFTGKRLHYVDRFSGQRVACEVLVLTFGYSNMTFARALPSQKLDDVLTGLAALLHEAGGSPAVLVPDNMKTAVSKPDRYEPVVQPAFLACCTHYNMVVLPARVGKPQDKAKVERHVRFLYEQVYARMLPHTPSARANCITPRNGTFLLNTSNTRAAWTKSAWLGEDTPWVRMWAASSRACCTPSPILSKPSKAAKAFCSSSR